MTFRSKFFHLAITLSLVISMAGCIPLVLVAAGAGAVGGYAVSRDTFEGVSAKGQDEIWDASNHILAIMGEVKNTERKSGTIEALVGGVKVTVSIIPISLTATKLRIKARKGIFPRVVVAQDVYTKIMHQLEQ